MKYDFHEENHTVRSLAQVFTANFQIYRIIGREGVTQIRQNHSKIKEKKVKFR